MRTRQNKKHECERALFRCLEILRRGCTGLKKFHVRDLANEMECSVRTIERDIILLRRVGFGFIYIPPGSYLMEPGQYVPVSEQYVKKLMGGEL